MGNTYTKTIDLSRGSADIGLDLPGLEFPGELKVPIGALNSISSEGNEHQRQGSSP